MDPLLERMEQNLSALPQVAWQTMKLLQDPDSTAGQLERMISSDQAITGRVLRLANSAYYGSYKRISSLSHAIVILGFGRVQALVTAAVYKSLYQVERMEERLLWEHALAVSMVSRMLAIDFGYREVEQASTAGLMHDIGKVIMNQHFGQQYLEVFDAVKAGTSTFIRAEADLIGITHTDVGGMVAHKWSFSPALVEAVFLHHNPRSAQEDELLCAIVSLANSICVKLGVGPENVPDLDLLEQDANSLLGLKEEAAFGLLEKATKELTAEDNLLSGYPLERLNQFRHHASEMMLKAGVPINIFLMARDPTAFGQLRVSFQHGNFPCEVLIIGGEPHKQELEGTTQYACFGTALEITIDDCEEGTLKETIQNKDFGKLIELLCEIVNRFVLAVRDFGDVPHLREIRFVPEGDHQATIQNWKVEFCEKDTSGWAPLVPLPTTGELPTGLASAPATHSQIVTPSASAGVPQPSPHLVVQRWPEIEEAVKDNICPTPEQESTTNAIKHLDHGSFRLALVESITSLEIVLARFSSLYFKHNTNLSDRGTRDVLSPALGLTNQVTSLHLVLSSQDLNQFELYKIWESISWRNNVVHENGNIPSTDPATIRDRILSVVGLTFLLARHAHQLEVPPEVTQISQDFKAKFGTYPQIWVLENHRVLTEFVFVALSGEFPQADVLESAVADLIDYLKQRDTRFDPESHLFVRFLRFPGEQVARWYKGKLEFLEGSIVGRTEETV